MTKSSSDNPNTSGDMQNELQNARFLVIIKNSSEKEIRKNIIMLYNIYSVSQYKKGLYKDICMKPCTLYKNCS